jgi:hypothetical protein
MARFKPKTRRGDSAADHPDFLRHLAELGLASADEYRAWCERRGFSQRLRKSANERRRERVAARHRGATGRADERFTGREGAEGGQEEVIAAIFAGEAPDCWLSVPPLDAVDRLVRSPDETDATKRAARRLFIHLARHTRLLSNERGVDSLGRREGNTYFEAVTELARHADVWIRTPEWWVPTPNCKWSQFGSLARHLTAAWPVPDFLDAAWFMGRNAYGDRRRQWFLNVGRGENIRHADLPIPLTKKMAHHFLEAPGFLSIDAAIRWGQIRALGGDEGLVRAVVGTRLEFEFEHDEFWLSVFRWFVEQQQLDRNDVGPIIDYIRHRKFEPSGAVDDKSPGAPPQPHFTMKGRSLETLLELVDDWHRRLGKAVDNAVAWPASGIPAFRLIEGSAERNDLKYWTVDELLGARALAREGREMRHCVAVHVPWCVQGRSSIWSMGVDDRRERRKVLTIEVDPGKRAIRQARGKCNAPPDDKALAILRRWAADADLALVSV